MIPSYIKDSKAAFIVYDISNRESFVNLDNWIKEIKEECSDDYIIAIIGNKNDLVNERKVEKEEGKKKAEEFNCLFQEMSAKTGENLTEFINDVINIFVEKNIGDNIETKKQNNEINLNNENAEKNKTKKKRKCC